jgi:hypothetical protein
MKFHARSISCLASVSVLLLLSMGALTAQTILPIGSFGFLLSTSFTDPTNQGGAAILGVMNFDGTGIVRGPFTLEYGSGGPLPATTIRGTFAGTYSSNTDGTGSITIAISNGVNMTFDMVIADVGHSLELIATSCSGSVGIDLSASVLSGVGMHAKQPPAVLKGSYGGQFTYSPQPSRGINVATFDGAGNVTMSITFVGTGPTEGSGTYTGTYTVKANATGTLTLAAVPGQAAQTFVFVITNEDGPGLLLLQTNRRGNGVALGTARLQ